VNRIPLAALLALGVFSFARADEGAYKNLVGMAQAAPDRGPEADDAPTDASPKMGTLKDAVADVPSPRARSDAAPFSPFSPFSPFAAGSAAPKAGAAASPAAAAPRLWTRLYATLLPSWRRPAPRSSAFETAVSTGPAGGRTPLAALMPPPDSEAVSAGERRGLAELMSVSDPAAQ
jgi:hypothetical protein